LDRITNIVFPAEEQSKIACLQDLFNRAYEYGKKREFKSSGKYNYNDLTADGFFPYYFSKRVKVLFIGLEHYGFYEQNYIDYMYEGYKTEKNKNKQFNYLMYYLAYAFNNNFPNWLDIPEISGKSFATKEGVSFAFMNISKFTNDTGSSKAYKELIDEFTASYANKEIELHKNQIEILEPDVIISMNINEYTKIDYLGELKYIKSPNSNVAVYEYLCKSKKIPLLDTWHFSKPGLNEIEELYIPLKDAYFEYIGNCT
jgi:hypothetical protein